MEFIRRDSDYALRSLAYMAKFPKGKILNAETIAAKQDVPVVFLRKIFQRLSKAQIVDSQKGPRGGFSLSKDAKKMSLKDILEATQGRVSLNDCLFEEDVCRRSKKCRIKRRLSGLQKELFSLLQSYTLSDLI